MEIAKAVEKKPCKDGENLEENKVVTLWRVLGHEARAGRAWP